MLDLQEAGLPTGVIAKRVGVGQRTIQHWLAQEHGHYAGPRKPRRSPLDWSTRYLRERWDAGERNGTVLWEELKAKGYTGSSRSVYRHLAKWREHPRKRGLPASLESVPRSPFEHVTPGKVVGWMLAPPGPLRPKAQAQVGMIVALAGTLTESRKLA